MTYTRAERAINTGFHCAAQSRDTEPVHEQWPFGLRPSMTRSIPPRILTAVAGAVLAISAALPMRCLGASAEPVPEPVAVQNAIVIRAARMLDVRSGTIMSDVAIYVVGERIEAVGSPADIARRALPSATVVDLGDATVLPGLIDCHTHLLARIPDADHAYAMNLLTKSQAYRALEGAANALATLRSGFTTVRDVGNEGSGYADVALRDAIDNGLIEGPRMHVATRGIAAVGQYFPFRLSSDLADFPSGAQMISGAEDARLAVRQQIGGGADLIKVYADWERATLTTAELGVIVEEAHAAGLKVAAHAQTRDGIRNAVAAGVDSIEHGDHADRDTLKRMQSAGIYLVPTLSVMDAWAAQSADNAAMPRLVAALEASRETVAAARAAGVRIALGSDPASGDRHGRNADELVALTQRGGSVIDAIRAATTVAADLVGAADDIGTLEFGKYADVIAVRGNPLTDIGVLKHVEFVMKGGRIVRNDLVR